MKVKDFIKQLKECDPEAEVIISIDAEGNGFSKLEDIDKGTIDPRYLKRSHIDTYFSDNHSDGDCCLEPGERANLPKVICLWP